MLADVPEDQAARLAELHSYDILDSAPEAAFDDVVGLVAKLLDVPVALVSLVDETRQWFKARIGMEPTQTPLEQSICSHAILDDAMTEIADTLGDPRTLDNPLCCGPLAEMRFYAGAPLVTPTGHKLGTLCVLDDKPRQLTDTQREVLRVMADQVMRQLDLRRALAAEAVLRDEIDHRVKNSLQTVSSFLRIYRSRSDHAETREILEAVNRRVTAVAELHAALYQSGQHGEVALDTYLGRMVALLSRQAPDGITVTSALAPAMVSPQRAAALALIVSEFAANAFKHAFPEGAQGHVAIAVTQQDHDLVLSCEDNGTGGGAPAGNSTGIGMRLMDAAADQLGGTLQAGPAVGGYRLRLVFPLDPARRVTGAAPSGG
ncbi:histidine kinase dimerization/phosphoacceptor domain -containing protein [Tropicibacter oceani]|uniref:Histidine kinase dimerization/phosphoacceptor domain -containing protein n=1 Tax=Tropicibacter oceani TaxID=3058420 RepID=A0ABY8QDT4_9RHOB|nr:histidine kinase dimerization/phosphoacceptor domain -containing protein [Tropicibacter oceani]WGW02782.1 histidine kinase dimerization/phosphoacceptor domain -containing protein [Tropicibacter oceani]